MGHFEKGRWVEELITHIQIRDAIISNAKKICGVYGFNCDIDNSFIPTIHEVSVKITVLNSSEIPNSW